MKRNKLLLLVSSLGVLILLVAAAYQENFLTEWRQVQAAGRSDEGAIPVMLRQVVNPALGISDRCVSCHVAMAPGEQSVTGAPVLAVHKPVVHDPAEYGCTVCHAGQGLATEKEAAHGTIEFWPQPMIPVGMSLAGCGTCHATPGVPNREKLQDAVTAFQRLDCLACHRVDGRGGTIRPDGGGMEGADLSRVGIAGYDAEWYPKHQKKSAEATTGPWKNSFGKVDDADQALLSTYLATRVAAPGLIEAKAVFLSTGCLGCHKVSGVGGDDGPDITRAGEKDPGQVDLTAAPGAPTLANWQADHFRAPGSRVVDSQMPALGLDEKDVQLLTMYTMSLRRRDVPGTYLPRDRLRVARLGEREFSTDGATLFGAFCAGCHGLHGQGRRAAGMTTFPSIANPGFLARAPEALIRETVRKGRPGRKMPAWEREGGLRPGEIDNVVQYLRSMNTGEATTDSRPARWVSADAAQGKRWFETACSGCHGLKGEGGEGPALHNQVLLSNATDTYLVETVLHGRRGTHMVAFGDPSPVHRTFAQSEIESVVAYLRTWETPAAKGAGK